MEEKIVRLEEGRKQDQKRIDNLEKEIIENRELTTAVKELAVEVKYMREDILKIDERVKVIEDKPKKRYENIVVTIISCIVTGIVTYFLSRIGLK